MRFEQKNFLLNSPSKGWPTFLQCTIHKQAEPVCPDQVSAAAPPPLPQPPTPPSSHSSQQNKLWVDAGGMCSLKLLTPPSGATITIWGCTPGGGGGSLRLHVPPMWDGQRGPLYFIAGGEAACTINVHAWAAPHFGGTYSPPPRVASATGMCSSNSW